MNETPPLGKMEREAPENSVREINDVLNGYFLKNSNLIPKKHNEQNSKRAILVTEYSDLMTSLISAKGFPGTLQFRCCCCCFPLAQFPDSESNTIRAFGNLGRQNIAHIIRSWLLLVGFPSIYLFPLTFYYQQQEETRLNPQHFAWRSQLNISVNHLQVLLST